MRVLCVCGFLLLSSASCLELQQHKQGAPTASFNTSLSGIQKVVVLLKEMKTETIKQGDEDREAFDKYTCWCETTEAEKKAAIKAAEEHIRELEAFLEEFLAKEGELKTEIAALKDDIAADTEALDTATALRKEEHDKFLAEEADLKETLSALKGAIDVLSKVQLVQKPDVHKEALLQVKGIVHRVSSKFAGIMQKDLYDLFGELKTTDHQKGQDIKKTFATGSFLGEVFLPKHEAAALAQNKDLPWVKTEEELGKEAKPNDLVGMAAGAKSYNARSGQILGILKTQGDKFAKNLAAAQKEDLEALIAFQKLAAAKTAEIMAATKQKDAKEAELAALLDKVAKSKEDLEATKNTMDADQKFLAEMLDGCKSEAELYAKRNKVRSEEILALGETLVILTGDEARSLFDKTLSFMQVRAENHRSLARVAMQEQARTKAMTKILRVAKKHKSWLLSSLAVRVKLDAFTRVKEAMDKMLAELKAEQKAEYAKWETCKKDIDTTEDKIWEGKVEKRDLAEKHADLVNTIKKLTSEIAELNHQVAEDEVSLKQAGEMRKAENELFQTSIADERATITILKMALLRLEEFYKPKAKPALVDISLHVSVEPPPPKPSGPEAVGYKKDGTAGGVMGLLDMIIADATREEDDLHASEQKSQESYAAYVAATTTSIEADREAIAEKEKQLASAEGDKSETEEAQLANQASLDKLSELLGGLHAQCDFILKYFDIRQTARAEEMDAIEEAKAILSGADFS